jgi:hypothetical protein
MPENDSYSGSIISVVTVTVLNGTINIGTQNTKKIQHGITNSILNY